MRREMFCQPKRHFVRILRVLLASATSSLLLAACSADKHLGFLQPQGPIADAQRTHLLEVVGLVMIAVLPALILIPFVAWRYRRKKNRSARYTPDWGFSWSLELVAWGVPVIVVAVMAVLLIRNARELDPYRAIASTQPPERVQVVAYDWKWLFIYPEEGIASVNELAFPADRPLALELTSDTVMQSLQIPSLGGQMYMMGGMVTQLNLMANQPGSYPGENTMFNGRGFHQQKFTASAMTEADFKKWVARARSSNLPLDSRTAEVLAQRSTMEEFRSALGERDSAASAASAATQAAASLPTSKGPVLFSAIPDNFFHSLVTRTMQGTAQQPLTQGQSGLGLTPPATAAEISPEKGPNFAAAITSKANP